MMHTSISASDRVLNIFSSSDLSSQREDIKEMYSNGTTYKAIDFWEDRFLKEGSESDSERHKINEDSGTFDIVIYKGYNGAHK